MKLIKRNGSEVIFDREKIAIAVTRANEAVNENQRISAADIENIALEVERLCLTMVRSAGVEEIQDLVEKEIMKLGAFDLAKAYITYRYKRELIRKSNTTDDKIMSLIECNNEEVKQENANKNDRVVINGVGYNIRTLLCLLNVLLLVGDHHKIKFYNSDPSRCSVLIGTKLKCLIMPMQYEEDSIDAEREGEGCTRTFSYENFINDFVFNSWRKTNKPSNLSWLD